MRKLLDNTRSSIVENTSKMLKNERKKCMICQVCGRSIANENANFCEYCGASFRELGHSNPQAMFGGASNEDISQRTKEELGTENQVEKPTSFWGWFSIMILPYVPVFGMITYVVMLFIWAFGSDTSPTKKNWARAKLVVTLIGIVLMAFLMVYVATDIVSSGMSIEEYVNTTYY